MRGIIQYQFVFLWYFSECVESPYNCTACKPGDVLQVKPNTKQIYFTCQRECDKSFYPNAHNNCQVCQDSNCDICLDGGVYCRMCAEGYYLEINQCIAECSDGLHSDEDGSCHPYCPENYFLNHVTSQCERCQSNCRKCHDESICTSCSAGFYLEVDYCVRDCSPGFVAFSTLAVTESVRLMGSRSRLQGRVEIYHNGENCIG